MTFDEVLDQVRALLQQCGRVTYRSLKRRFDLDDDYLEDLKGELIRAEGVAADEDGDVLVWTGSTTIVRAQLSVPDSSQPPAPQTPDSQPQPLAASGERRQLTVQFIDLVGSTTLSQQLDPEDYHARVVAYQTACRQVIARYEGHIAQYLGDGMLVYFGYPTAHEEDAVRAVRSGLESVAAVSELKFTPPLQVRIGIHTGPVMVGEIGAGERTERLALGDTPNIAARVQSKAEPNTVFISQATYRLVQGFFTYEAVGPQSLKNVAIPIELYRVHGEGEAHTRFEVSVQKGLTPLVGRDLEISLLQERWAQAKGGEGQVVLLSGEPGIGKSRLVQTLKERVMAEDAVRLELRCSPYHQNSAFYPIIDHLQHLLQFHREESPQAKLEKLQQALARYRFPQVDTLPLLAALLSLPPPDGALPLTLSPQKQKQKTQEALVAWLVEEAEGRATYCAWEDLQWADPSTLELLTLFLDQVSTTHLLAVLTFRPEFIPPWHPHSHITQLTLNRLGRQQVAAMVEKVTRGKALPREVVRQIVAKTDGVPLFVEELTKMVLELGLLIQVNDHYELTGPLPPLAIPSTLQDSLMARLDRLATVKEVAQLGATLGREFSYELLQAVACVPESSLQRALAKLVEAEVLYQRGLPPQARYLFKHALIQDAAYQSLLRSTRQQYHRQIAQVLEERFPETKETQPELLAYHYTEAGLTAQAIPYWQKAGERASQRSAHVEAINHLTKGLELLQTLPETPKRIQQELTLQLALGAPLMVTKGWAAPEVERAYTRARALCQYLGETPELFSVLWGLWYFHFVRAEYRTARELGEQCLRLAQKAQDPALLMEAYFALGSSLVLLGEPIPARAHLMQGVALYDFMQHRALAFLHGQDPQVASLSVLAYTLWQLGYPDQALKSVQEALALARELSHPYSLAFALGFAASIHALRREGQIAQEWAEATITLSTEQGVPFWLAWGMTTRGWALAEQGQGKDGITQIRQGIGAWRATGAELWRPYWLSLLAEAYRQEQQAEEGLNALTEALAVVDTTAERWDEAELYRLRGELILQSKVQGPKSKVEETEKCFLKAIEVARKQQAKSWELRAVMSLARLWQQQGKKAEARQLLAEIYGWFTEGFDTADLQDAKALLDEFS